MSESQKKPKAVSAEAGRRICERSADREHLHCVFMGDAQRDLADIEIGRALPVHEALTELQNTRISLSN